MINSPSKDISQEPSVEKSKTISKGRALPISGVRSQSVSEKDEDDLEIDEQKMKIEPKKPQQLMPKGDAIRLHREAREVFKVDQKTNETPAEEAPIKEPEEQFDDSPRGQLKEFLEDSPEKVKKDHDNLIKNRDSSLMRERQRVIASMTANDLIDLSEALYKGDVRNYVKKMRRD